MFFYFKNYVFLKTDVADHLLKTWIEYGRNKYHYANFHGKHREPNKKVFGKHPKQNQKSIFDLKDYLFFFLEKTNFADKYKYAITSIKKNTKDFKIQWLIRTLYFTTLFNLLCRFIQVVRSLEKEPNIDVIIMKYSIIFGFIILSGTRTIIVEIIPKVFIRYYHLLLYLYSLCDRHLTTIIFDYLLMKIMKEETNDYLISCCHLLGIEWP